MRTRRLVLGGLFACALLAPGAPAGAVTTTVVIPGRLTVLSDVTEQLPALPAPADGRVRGYGFAAKVTGDECARAISGSGTTLTTSAADEVCALRLSIEFAPHLTVTDSGQLVPGLTAHLATPAGALAISTSVVDASSDEELAVAIPRDADATLVMSAAGYSQSFSLTASERTGASPTALYRAPSGYEVTASPKSSVTLSETAVHGGATASVRIGLSSLTLSYFEPGDPLVHAASPDGAYLGLGFSESDLAGPTGVSFSDFGALPGSAMHLATPGGEVAGQLVETTATGLVANTYAFSVPATLDSGSLTIAPGTRSGYEKSKSSSIEAARTAGGTLVPVRFGSGTLPVAVPDPLPGGTPTTSSTTTTRPAGGAGATTSTVPSDSVPSGTAARDGSPVHHHERHHETERHRHEQQKAHVGAKGATEPAAVTTAARRRRHADLVPVVATAAAVGGTSVIVVPLVVVLRRRRIGRRLRIRFPRPEPPRPPPQPASGADEVALPAMPAEAALVPELEPPRREAIGPCRLHVRVLGPLEIDGVDSADPNRAQLIELCCYLTLHAGRDVPSDELRTELAKLDSCWSPDTLYKRVAGLRKALGRDVFVKSGKAGYRLEGALRCDWAEFSALLARRSIDPEARRAELTEALALVRGVPFAGVPAGQYRWALSTQLAGDMLKDIEDAAVELVGLELDRSDGRAAARAARAGLRAAPYSSPLLAGLLRAGAVEGRIGLQAAWREADRLAPGDGELRSLKERLEVEIDRR